jgi:hypothetical protein
MPFDCTPIIDAREQLPAVGAGMLNFRASPPKAELISARPLPLWHSSRHAEYVDDALAVLARARELIADEQHWCQRSFARGWFDMPVPIWSAFVRRYCALGAIMRAGRKLGLPIKEARNALEWQTVRPIPDWNDDRWRTHRDVIAAFDAAIAALDRKSV